MGHTMRGSLRASHTALRAGCPLAIAALAALGGCSYAPVRQPERKAPPRVLVVALERVALRTTAWVELHAWLAATARSRSPTGDPDLDAAARGYASALADDDRDELLGRTTFALEACDDERCARNAVTGTAFATPYLAALPGFLTRHWIDRAEAARAGIEIALAAAGPEVEPLITRLARDLELDWPTSPAIVDVVADAPQAGREAPIRVLLAARGNCFAQSRSKTESDRMHDARIIDCVLSYAALHLEARSALGIALGRELAARGKSSEIQRAWTALVVHAVATLVTGWEPKHASVLRRSAYAIMPDAMDWLAREWPARMRGEPAAELAVRYAALFTKPTEPAQ
jgi:hypothetical protein